MMAGTGALSHLHLPIGGANGPQLSGCLPATIQHRHLVGGKLPKNALSQVRAK
jgi:hypothetical protein